MRPGVRMFCRGMVLLAMVVNVVRVPFVGGAGFGFIFTNLILLWLLVELLARLRLS